MSEQNHIDVPSKAIEAFLAVRDSGKTNMLDSGAVLYYMNEMEHYEAVIWLARISESGVVRVSIEHWKALIEAVNDHFRVTHTLAGD